MAKKQNPPTAIMEAPAPIAVPTPLPGRLPAAMLASGLYTFTGHLPRRVLPSPGALVSGVVSDAALRSRVGREELRLDVDGAYPRMVASGTIARGLATRVHWIADLSSSGADQWAGNIWYRDGDVTAVPHTNVDIRVLRDRPRDRPRAVVTFSGGGAPERVATFMYNSPFSHPVEFEFDCVEGTTPVISLETHAHPNRPSSLPDETLTIDTVYRRAGFDVRRSAGDGIVPLSLAGADAEWSDMEMHDAMQSYWSRFANRAQWAMWVFFAALHEQGTSLGGIMFDDIGPNQRQGTALFTSSFISQPPPGDPAPDAWVQRMIFWTACHEMGHAFNLAHSWQKALGTPWIALANEPDARSFMNYPYRVTGGQSAFFADFEYRFSDGELLFLRHAPGRFVEMGNADWFDHHGLQQLETAEPTLRLIARVNRERPVFEFLEPVVIELKLTNIDSEPQLVDDQVLSMSDRLTLLIKKRGRPARQFIPYAQYCRQTHRKVLAPRESLYDSVFLSAGRNGWDLAEPGDYAVYAVLHQGDENIVSLPLTLRVLPPRSYDEQLLAQDFISDEVGRVLAFDGSRVLDKANETLRAVVERLSDQRVAAHARVALASALARDTKQLQIPGDRRPVTSAQRAGGELRVTKADPQAAHREFAAALTSKPELAAETLGHVDYKYYVDRFTDFLKAQGETKQAVQIQDGLLKTFSARGVSGRVLQDVKERRDSYGGSGKGAGR